MQFQKNANGVRAFMGNFLCGLERVKHFVKVHLYYMCRNLKKDKRNVDVATPWKNFCGRPWDQACFVKFSSLSVFSLR